MPEEKNLYEQMLEEGIPKESIHKVLHYLVMEQAKSKHRPKRTLVYRIKYFFLFKLYTLKRPHVISLLKSKALALLKTQFAKKPKNPV